MKNTFCIALLTTLSLQAAQHQLVLFTPFATLALAVASSLPALARTGAESYGYESEGECSFEGPEAVTIFGDYVDEAFRQLKDWQLTWQRTQGEVVGECKKPFSIADRLTRLIQEGHMEADSAMQERMALCPLEGEYIASYVERVTGFTSQTYEDKPKLSTDDLMKDAFWDMPWSMQRYLLAMNIKLGLLDPNGDLPVSKLTPLDHASKQKDEELIFFLWERGARKANHKDTLDFVKKDVMMRSSDERSIEILREIVRSEDGRSKDWLTFEWATDLPPKLVEKKLDVLVKPVYNLWGDMRPKLFFSRKMADSIPGDTPGAQLLREFAQKNAGERGCTIQ